MTDTVQVTVTFTRSLAVNGLQRNFTASLTFPLDEYNAMAAEDVEQLKLEKLGRYVTEEESRLPTKLELEEERLRTERKIAELNDIKAKAATADDEIAELSKLLPGLSK